MQNTSNILKKAILFEKCVKLVLSMTRSKALSLLGFSPNDNPTDSEVRAAQRAKANIYHTDKITGGNAERMVETNVAGDILTGKMKPDREDFSTAKPTSPSWQKEPVRTTETYNWEERAPRGRKVNFTQAEKEAGIGDGIDWIFVTSRQMSGNYSAFAAFGIDVDTCVFAAAVHFYKEFPFENHIEDFWKVEKKEIALTKNPSLIRNEINNILKSAGYPKPFNGRVILAPRGWIFNQKVLDGNATNIEQALINKGIIKETKTSKKHSADLIYHSAYVEKPGFYKVPGHHDYIKVELIIDGISYFLSERDLNKLMSAEFGITTKVFPNIVFGDYYYNESKKNLNRIAAGKMFTKWLAENLVDIPEEVAEILKIISMNIKTA
jgi:hypothetical protein